MRASQCILIMLRRWRLEMRAFSDSVVQAVDHLGQRDVSGRRGAEDLDVAHVLHGRALAAGARAMMGISSMPSR